MTITIILKENNVLGSTITYYLTKASETACEKIEKDHNLLKKGVDNKNAILIAVGDGMKLSTSRIENMLESFEATTNGTRQIHYRNYEINIEEQQKNAHLINMCPDTKMCWQSALRKIGYRNVKGLATPANTEAFCLIWKTVKNV